MALNWSKLRGNPLVTIFALQGGVPQPPDACYTYCDDGTLYQWDASGNNPSPVSPPRRSSLKIPDVNRVIFPDNDQTKGAFLTGFNVVGEKGDSQAQYKKGSLALSTCIRCLLQSRDETSQALGFGENIRLDASFDAEHLTKFSLRHTLLVEPNGSVDLLQPEGTTRPKTLKAAIIDLATGKTRPAYLGKLLNPLETDPDKRLYGEINTEWSHTLRGLLASNPGPETIQSDKDEFPRALSTTRRSLSVSFRETGQKTGKYAIQFEALFEKASARGIRCFAIAPAGQREEEARFDLANQQMWYFRQRTAVASCETESRKELQGIAEWVLELSCLSHQSTADREDHWIRTGVRGIQGYAGATGASFLPRLVPPVNNEQLTFTAVYLIADRVTDLQFTVPVLADPKTPQPQGKTEIRPFSVQYVGPRLPGASADSIGVANLQFPLCETTSAQPLEIAAALTSTSLSIRESQPGFVFSSDYALYGPAPATDVRMGSLELGFGQRKPPGPARTNPSYFYLFDLGTGSGPQILVSGLFIITKLLPGSQDDLPEDSSFAPNTVPAAMPNCRTGSPPFAGITNSSDDQKEDVVVERAFYRPRPLLINRAGSNSDVPLMLQVNESSGPLVNRTVYLSLDVDNSMPITLPTSIRQQTIVLDADPFLVAQLSFPPLLAQAGSVHIASWDNSSGNGAKWQIPLTKSGFSLALPVQAMGEEMIKNKDFSLPLDFRLGPPTVVAIEAGPQYTAYAEVPWNLRRILGYAGQTSPGVTVDRLDYELLYGLSCDASQPFVRLAEVFALLGAIPGRLPEILAAQDPHFDADTYRKWRGEWAYLHQRYQARLAILEPWDSHVSGSLTLKHGMSCVIRYTVDNAQKQCSQTLGKALPQFAPDASTGGNPFRLPYADLDDPITPAPRSPTAPLRGGVTWGFESRNIFCATLSDRFSTTNSAAVSDLDLTALGGFGHQEASFDSGRTSIFADVAMGRTYYYKLERLGRLGVFWNKAKHVIVYERSVVPSRQFYLEQNPDNNPKQSYGIPILRKVQEYVEILEEQRAYPDDHLLTNAANGTGAVTPAQRCGCIAACVFQKGARFPVSSSWGSDVNSMQNGSGTAIGWKVPLWKRGAMPADVYPFPKATLSMMSDFGGSSKQSPCDIGNPENVYFYTDTRPNTGSDSDQWGAIVGIDTVDLGPNKPGPTMTATNGALPTVGDAAVPAGFSICTFQLLPPLQPADVVANRNGPPMAVVLDTVTMMRGFTAPNPKSVDSYTTLLAAYATAWEKELNGLGPSGWNKTSLQALADRVTGQIQQPLADIQNKIKTGSGWPSKWTDAVQKYNGNAITRFTNQVLTASDDGARIVGGLNQVKLDVTAALNSIPANAGNAAVLLRQLVDEQFAQIQQAVLDTSASPGGLSLLLQQYHTAANGVISQATTGIAQLKAVKNATLAQLTKQVLDLRTNLEAIWISAGSSGPLPGLADIGPMLAAGPLTNFSGQYSSLINALTSSVTSGDLGTLQSAIKNLPGFDANATADINKFSQTLKAGFASTDSSMVTYLDCFRNDLTQVNQFVQGGKNNWATSTYQQLISAIPGGKEAVRQAFEDPTAGVYATFNGRVTALTTSLSQEVSTLNTAYQTAYNSAANALSGAIDNIQTTAAGALSDLKSALINALQNLPTNIGLPVNGTINPQDVATLQQAVLQFRDQQLGEAHQFVDKYLGVIRGAVGDVTANTNQLLSLVRAFGDAPIANTLSFLPGKIGYYFQQAQLPTQVDLSPVTSILRQAGNVASDASGVLNNALNVMHLQIPTTSLANRLVPPDLTNLKLSDIFPKFSGIDLSGLFRDIDLGESGDKIQISHGTDPQTLSAWVQANIGAHLQDVPVFDTGDIALRLVTADFNGQVKVDVSPQGTQQLASGNVTGDWALLVMGQQVVTLSATQLIFDSSGKFQFIVQPKNVKLPGVLNFITQYLTQFLGGGSGLSIQIQGTQINAQLSLPIPDVSGLTSGISNLRLSCLFGLGLDANNRFQLDVGFGLSDPLRPFNIAFFILGGAGYLQATTHFVPASGMAPTCTVNFGIMASASLAIAFGPISGGVYAFLGIKAGFTTGGPGLSLSAVLLMRGQVNLAGIISASVCMQLSVSEQAGTLTGAGYFGISVSICWCFTLNISVNISYSVGSFGGGQKTSRLENRQDNPILVAALSPGPLGPMGARQARVPVPVDELTQLIDDYVVMTNGM
jgi:hypothetical protein